MVRHSHFPFAGPGGGQSIAHPGVRQQHVHGNPLAAFLALDPPVVLKRGDRRPLVRLIPAGHFSDLRNDLVRLRTDEFRGLVRVSFRSGNLFLHGFREAWHDRFARSLAFSRNGSRRYRTATLTRNRPELAYKVTGTVFRERCVRQSDRVAGATQQVAEEHSPVEIAANPVEHHAPGPAQQAAVWHPPRAIADPLELFLWVAPERVGKRGWIEFGSWKITGVCHDQIDQRAQMPGIHHCSCDGRGRRARLPALALARAGYIHQDQQENASQPRARLHLRLTP
jgi:hypothetical protein